eukprot:COSAG05_NODE_604_length_8399_cov_6.936145_4_plen_166_part_00
MPGLLLHVLGPHTLFVEGVRLRGRQPGLVLFLLHPIEHARELALAAGLVRSFTLLQHLAPPIHATRPPNRPTSITHVETPETEEKYCSERSKIYLRRLVSRTKQAGNHLALRYMIGLRRAESNAPLSPGGRPCCLARPQAPRLGLQPHFRTRSAGNVEHHGGRAP